jgi:hypothetical protein
MAYDGGDPTGLVGEQLDTVAFVMDYVEFKFNGPVLRALTNPVVEGDGLRLRFPEPGSRDALCSLIGSEVAAVTVSDDDRIELELHGDRRLTIPLDQESRLGVEAAHYVPAARDGTLRTADMRIW